jgi:hypothetical protein
VSVIRLSHQHDRSICLFDFKIKQQKGVDSSIDGNEVEAPIAMNGNQQTGLRNQEN